MTPKKPSALAEALASANTPPPGPDCGMWTVLVALDDADADAVRATLVRTDVTSSGIARILRSFDHVISEGTVNRHRKGLCSCKARGRG